MLTLQVAAVLKWYPRVYFACHTRHVRDPETGRSLSSHQVSILDHLSRSEPTSLTELAAHMGVTASTMSLGVDRLEADGYVTRARDRADARRLQLLLTAKGQKIREAYSVLDPKKVEAMLSHLTKSERSAALEGLELLGRAANRHIRRIVEAK